MFNHSRDGASDRPTTWPPASSHRAYPKSTSTDESARCRKHCETEDLIVVDGDAEVSGEDGISRVVPAGSAVLWAADESHETLSRNGLTALIVEGEGVVEGLA